MTTTTKPLSADEVKAKARELGADLVGIADGARMNAATPPPETALHPSTITDIDGDRVIVIAKRINSGTSRLLPWNERHKYYNDELTISDLEATALELVLWLEDRGVPALISPPHHVDPWKYSGDPDAHMEPLLSLNHAAVEAGLGTLGLNLQLLTPEFGPRVVLSAVLCSADIVADEPRSEALCHGPSCGRCLRSCPGDVIEHWDRDWQSCDRYRSPHGFPQLVEFLTDVFDETDQEKKVEMVRSQTSFELWQSVLRGSGVITGCRRCADVCPVGEDYESMLSDVLDEIPETTPEKELRLVDMLEVEERGELPPSYQAQSRWIGKLSGGGGDG